jgi:glycosyltransferase involved in cell wall biosynthesis
MKRVCMLTTGFPRFPGDLFGHFVLELAKELVKGEWEVRVVAPHQKGLPCREVMEGVQVRRFRYFWPAAWQRVAYGGGIPANLRQSWLARLQVPFFLLGFWWQALWQTRPCALVHGHWTVSGLVAYLATRWWRRPLVLSVRGSDLHLMGRGWRRGLNQKVYAWMDRIVAVSQDIGRKLAESGVPSHRIQVVYNGVDPRFRPLERQAMRQRLGLPEQGFIVLFVGLLVPVKGVDVLLKALAQGGNENRLCALVGDGPWRRDLEQQVEAAGLSGRVLFAGQRPADEIPCWMNAADLLVLPSLSEGRPNVVLEALSCGLAVVATRVGGTAELVRHGETGWLVESGDAAGLAQAIDRLRRDEPLRQRLGQAGRQSIQEGGLTWAASAQKVQAIYQELLEAA